MKNIFLIVLLLSIKISSGQMPVTDVTANATLAAISSKIAALNLELRQNNTLTKETNIKLQKMIQLLEKNNEISDDSKLMLNEELQAKKNAPDYVLNSNAVLKSQKLKTSILELYQTGVDLSKSVEHIDSKSITKFLNHLKNTLLTTNELINQANTILKTNSIINPEERLSKIESLNIDLEDVLKDLKNKIRSLKHKNSVIASRNTLINLSKNQ